MATTYRKLAELIRNEHYRGIPSDDASISLRHVAELVAAEVAWFAKKSAFENSNQGEATFANDQFISVWNNLELKTDAVTKEKYVDLPATPAGLPNNQEISSVAFTAYPRYKVVPLKQKDVFMEQFLCTPSFVHTYTIENGRIVFYKLNKLVTGPVSLKMIGAVSGDNLLDSALNVPKDTESEIFDKVLSKLNPNRSVPRDITNDSVPLPA